MRRTDLRGGWVQSSGRQRDPGMFSIGYEIGRAKMGEFFFFSVFFFLLNNVLQYI